MKQIQLIFLLMITATTAMAGIGKIEGRVVDETNQPMIGAIVKLDGTELGARTDLDGRYSIRNIEKGTYTLFVTYVSYDKKSISDVHVKDATPVVIDIVLNKSNKGLGEVVVKASMKKENINALLVQQKNMATISDGISAESIKRSPDKNTGDVLKRVTGVSISERKFVVIRGLSDRYNLALLNGAILPSTEADRKAFSFDMFPANMLDNITILKAATPDMPGEFSGGIIDLVTKDIPTENFLTLQLGTGGNSQGTFRSYNDTKNSKTDWLGFDDGMRALPSSFPSTDSFQSSTYTRPQKYEATKLLPNTWTITNHHAMLPNRVIQISSGGSKTFSNKSVLGAIGSISYNRSQRFNYINRNEYELGNEKTADYHDTIARDEVLAGAMLNVGYKMNPQHKLAFRNSFNINSDDQTINRTGISDALSSPNLIKAISTQYTSNALLNSQLSGDHSITKRKIKVQWNLNYNKVKRNTPDLQKMMYIRDKNNPDDSTYTAIIPTNRGSAIYAGKFYSVLNERIYNGRVDITIPFSIQNVNQSVRVGTLLQSKSRSFNSRILGYAISNPVQFNYALNDLPMDQIFSNENIGEKGYRIDDVTEPTGSYTANSTTKAGYIMMDNKFMKNFRVVYGIRIENFNQEINTAIDKNTPLTISKNNTNILPSLNLTYSINKKTNLRLCASKTVSRPEFRELAPFPFYDFNTSSVLTGNTDLKQCNIQNYDLRYELYPGKGELFSASVFYKHFDSPIELFTKSFRDRTYKNALLANNYGIETEFRKSLSFLTSHDKSILNSFSVFGNVALIKSVVKFNDEESVTNKERPLQGQSNYLINLGASFTDTKTGVGATLLYNRIGPRLAEVGLIQVYQNVYEYSRNVIDFQLSKKINRFDLRVSFGDLLHQPFIFYQNEDNSGVYSKTKSRVITKTSVGSSLSLSCAYKF